MKVFTDIGSWQKCRDKIAKKKSIGFVPTMGGLHRGHLSLLQQARQDNDVVVLTIFVNPAQFNDINDYQNYSINLEKDLSQAEKQQVDYVLTPTVEEMYPDECLTKIVSHEPLALQLEGAQRPGHFDGVLTIVAKLFNIIRPTRAYFGEKDYQQLQLIKKLAVNFFYPIEIIAGKTVRERSQLALSTRNKRLSPEQKKLAGQFARALLKSTSVEQLREQLSQLELHIDYLEELDGRRFAAVQIGDVRLIDNIAINKESS